MLNTKHTPAIPLIEPDIYTTGITASGAPYDAKARVYEFLVGTRLYNRIAWGTSPADYSGFAEVALQYSFGSILDVGCGGLAQTAQVYASCSNELVLMDNSIAMLRIARKRLLKLNKDIPTNIKLLLGNAFDHPYTERFDNLFSFGMLHLFEDKQAYLSSIFKALKPGGWIYLTCLTTDRKISARYIAMLHKQGEMATGCSSQQIIELIGQYATGLKYYTAGSMLFIRGAKK